LSLLLFVCVCGIFVCELVSRVQNVCELVSRKYLLHYSVFLLVWCLLVCSSSLMLVLFLFLFIINFLLFLFLIACVVVL